MSDAAPVATPDPNTPPAAAPAADPAPAAAPASLATGADVAPAAAPAAPSWPDDWRVKMAGDDKDALKQLERHADPASVWKKARELERKLSSGELKSVTARPAADADPEVIAAWRKENGLPAAPAEYLEKLTLPQGMVLGEADKPHAESFAKFAFDADMTPAQMSKALEWYYSSLDQQTKARDQFDANFQLEASRQLGQEWGGDYTRNMNAIRNFLAGQPQDFIDRLQTARTVDGRKLGDDPGFLKWMAGISLEMNPAATLVPPGANPAKTIGTRLAELNTMMADKSSAYWRGPQAESLQAEWRDLYNAQQSLKGRQAA